MKVTAGLFTLPPQTIHHRCDCTDQRDVVRSHETDGMFQTRYETAVWGVLDAGEAATRRIAECGSVLPSYPVYPASARPSGSRIVAQTSEPAWGQPDCSDGRLRALYSTRAHIDIVCGVHHQTSRRL